MRGRLLLRGLQATLPALLAPLLMTVGLDLFVDAVMAQDSGRAVDTGSATARFFPVDVYIDPHGAPLAAYQFELIDKNESIEIVGVEGGDHSAFARPPYYDRKALAHHHIILAAYSTDDDLPSRKTRVATVHVLSRAEIEPEFVFKLSVAASLDGTDTKGTASIVKGQDK